MEQYLESVPKRLEFFRILHNGPLRSEQAIFEDLASLGSSKGFIHAVAAICFRDNVVGFKDEPMADWTMLHGFAFSCDELTDPHTPVCDKRQSHR